MPTIARSDERDGASWRTTYDGVAVRFGAAIAIRLELRLDETLRLFSALHALRCARPVQMRPPRRRSSFLRTTKRRKRPESWARGYGCVLTVVSAGFVIYSALHG